MNLIIYLIAFLEWFTTLSVEIVALRQFTPIIGSNSISTSIILWVVLLALSAWYYRWWIIADRTNDIKKRLWQNLIASSMYYAFISFVFYGFVLEWLLQSTWSYFLSVLLTSIILFFIPVFFASQTIPLLSSLLTWAWKAESIWKLLFYSTLWSFLGSVGTSTVLFPLLGADKTAFVSPFFLTICSILLCIFFLKNTKLLVLSGFLSALYLFIITFSSPLLSGVLYESSNAYQDVRISENTDAGYRVFSLDDAYSSGIEIYSWESFFPYIQEVKSFVQDEKAKRILVIGAAWFTFPQEVSRYDYVEQIDVVDIDPNLKELAETYFLKEKLSSKINFIPEPSRYFLNSSDASYDMIFVDVYTGKSIPAQVLTREFFDNLKSKSESIYLNLVLDPSLDSNLARTTIATLLNVFPEMYYKNMNLDNQYVTNFIFTNNQKEGYIQAIADWRTIYTDDKHRIEYDKFLFEQELYK